MTKNKNFLGLEKIIFYLVIFLMPFQLRKFVFAVDRDIEWSSIFLYITDILLALLLFFWMAREWQGKVAAAKELLLGKNRALKILALIFMVLCAVSLVKAGSFYLGVWQWLKIAEMLFFVFYVRRMLHVFGKEKIMSFFVVTMVFQGVAGIMQFFLQRDLGLTWLRESVLGPGINGVAKIYFGNVPAIRAYGFFPHPNVFAIFLAAAIFFLFYIYLKRAEEERPMLPGNFFFKYGAVFGFSFFVLVLALVLTFSRVTIAAFLVFAFFYFLFLLMHTEIRYSLRPLTFFLFAITIVSFVSMLLVFNNELFDRFDVKPGEQAVTLRYFYNKLAVDEIKSDPLFGVGPGNFVENIPRGKALERSLEVTAKSMSFDGSDFLGAEGLPIQKWILQPVHNIYMLVASETGLLGLVVFMILIFYTLYSVIRNIRFKDVSLDLKKEEIQDIVLNVFKLTLLFIVLIFLVVGFFDHFFWTSQQGRLLLGLILGMLATAI